MEVGGLDNPRPEYPRPHLRRRNWVSLNGEWEFGAGEKQVFDRRILVPFCPESRLSGIGEGPGDTVWYRTRFNRPAGECVVLHFGAVDYRATVWVNDIEVARHEGGHTPFSADVSATLRGRDNVLVVRADDPLTDKTTPRGKQFWGEKPEGIFYTPTTGIWQTVWLEPLPERHIRTLRLTPDLDAAAVDFEVQGEGWTRLVVTLEGEVMGRWEGKAGHGRVALAEISPWHPDSPALYEVEAMLLDHDGNVADRLIGYFGLRSVGTRDGEVLLNGDPFVPRLVLDQGYFPDGLLTAPSDDALRGDIEAAMALGFNGARKHQKVEDPRWLYWADRLGFLVWDEMPSTQEFNDEAAQRLEAEWADVVRRDRDHPSIVAWVPANESFGLGPDAAPFLDELYHLTKTLDATRPVVSNDGWEHATTDLCTLHDYGSPAELAKRYRNLDLTLDPRARLRPAYRPGYTHCGEPVIVSEFGGVALVGSGGFGWSEVSDPG